MGRVAQDLLRLLQRQFGAAARDRRRVQVVAAEGGPGQDVGRVDLDREGLARLRAAEALVVDGQVLQAGLLGVQATLPVLLLQVLCTVAPADARPVRQGPAGTAILLGGV